MRHTRIGSIAVSALTAVLLSTGLAAGAAAGSTAYTPAMATGVVTEDPATPGKLLLMLDASGSMLEADPSGLSKMEAAKKALTGVVDSLPATSEVGLRVYGATVQGGTPTPEACADTQLVSPIKALDKAGLTAAIAGFQAKGETPIAHSLEKAIGDLGSSGKRNIILVSDGEESCVPDPCPVVQKLIGEGIDLQIDTVGFAVGDTARQQLQCIADAGHGTYYDAKNADQITASLTKLSARALRPFTLTGTPVRGGADAKTAPDLVPGQYTDSAEVSTQPNRFYRIKRTPGSTVRVALTAKAPIGTRDYNVDGWKVVLAPVDGSKTQCDAAQDDFRLGEGDAAVTVAATVLGQDDPAGKKHQEEVCQTGDLIAKVQHVFGTEGVPTTYELRYINEPPVSTNDGLPGAFSIKDMKKREATVAGSATPIVGGGSFNDAPVIGPGAWSDSFMPNEEIVYRLPLQFGQAAVITVDLPTPETDLAATYGPADHAPFTSRIFNPARAPMTRAIWNTSKYVLGAQGWHGKVTLQVPEIRYLNRYSFTAGEGNPESRAASLAGDYFFSLQRGPGDDLPIIPVRINVEVTGTPNGAPDYAESAVAPTSSPGATPSSIPSASPRAVPQPTKEASGSVLPWVGGGLLALAVLAGIGYAVARRRHSAPAEEK